MRYILNVLCVTSFSCHVYAATLHDDTNPVTPEIPEILTKSNRLNSTFDTDQYVQLFLNISINTNKTSDLIAVRQYKNGDFYIRKKDLTILRIKTNDDISPTQWLNLKDFATIKPIYIEKDQALVLNVPSALLNPLIIDLYGQKNIVENLKKLPHLNALILNYSLYNTLTNRKNTFSGALDALYNSHFGNFSSGFLYNGTDNNINHEKWVRLETKWQYVDADKIRIYTLGDFISNSSDWGSSVRLGGLQWSSAYTQRTDIVTSALPQFSGSAALPSTLDLYVNQQKIYSGLVSSGPFDLKQLPFISGNEVTLVTTDATGKQTITKKPYYFSSQILNKGINEFSIDLGAPRYNYGLYSSDYDNDVIFGSGSIRYGYTNTLTLSSGIESSTDGLVNLGAGLSKNLFGLGVLQLNFAASDYKNESGYSTLLGLEGRITKNLSFNTSYKKIFNDYNDLARVSELRYQTKYNRNTQLTEDLTYSSLASESLRLGLNYNFASGYSAYVGYNQLKYAQSAYRLLSLNLNANINKNWSVFATTYKDFDNHQNYGAYVALRYTPSTRLNAITSFSNDAGSISYRQEINGLSGPRIGDLGWGAYVEHNETSQNNNGSIYANYRSRPAYLTASYTESENTHQLALSATGALIVTQGNIFTANEIGDGYALVKNAGPNSQVLNGGVNLGTTDRKGQFLITNLSPYQVHEIYLDPSYLPLNWSLNATKQNAVVGYKQGTEIDFGAHKVQSGIVKILDKDKKPLSPGYEVRINQGQQSTIVGYDGDIFINNLQMNNLLEIDLLDKGTCKVNFTYHDEKQPIQKLGPYICQ